MWDVEQVRVAVARSKQRGRVAMVIADNLKTHTAAGSLLVRSLLSEFKEIDSLRQYFQNEGSILLYQDGSRCHFEGFQMNLLNGP